MIDFTSNDSHPHPRTKIVATLGPATNDIETLRQMIRAGVNVARLNFSHGVHADHAHHISLAREAARLEHSALAIMMDLQGPRLRVRTLAPDTILVKGAPFVLDAREAAGNQDGVGMSFAADLAAQIEAGERILIDDGRIELRVIQSDAGRVETLVEVGGPLGSRKGINLPDTRLNLPPLTKKDREDLDFGLAQDIDYVALSFVGSAEQAADLRRLIAERGSDLPIISKIERGEAVRAMHDIVVASDAVMVARGDLALEIGAEHVPIVQKELIREANAHATPVITATQMLDSMIDHPRPTRAETSDVANAILDGTDAVMLSGETAMGAYPVEAVTHMSRIASVVEQKLDFSRLGSRGDDHSGGTVTYAISGAAVQIAEEVGVSAIIAITSSGWTAQRVAHRRPRTRIIGATRREKSFRRLALTWGVEPILIDDYATTDEMVDVAITCAERLGLVERGESVVVTSGLPHGISGTTNMVQIRRIGGGD
jgi:pyruvate kinase